MALKLTFGAGYDHWVTCVNNKNRQQYFNDNLNITRVIRWQISRKIRQNF